MKFIKCSCNFLLLSEATLKSHILTSRHKDILKNPNDYYYCRCGMIIKDNKINIKQHKQFKQHFERLKIIKNKQKKPVIKERYYIKDIEVKTKDEWIRQIDILKIQ